MALAEYIVTVTGPAWINANDRGSWHRRAKLTKQWRQAAAWMAKHKKVEPMLRAHIDAYAIVPNKRRRDPANLTLTAKACIDGMVTDAGILPDDDDQHLEGPDMRQLVDPAVKVPTIEFRIYELNGDDS